MLNLNAIMVGTMNITGMAEFYEKVLGRPSETEESNWHGWLVGSTYLWIGEHSETGGMAKDPARIILNFETPDVQGEFERIKGLGAQVIKEPYEMEGMWIATFADPDGNYFQLMSPWEKDK
jgi:predicted enzyme related to lactoylglutathione lyase